MNEIYKCSSNIITIKNDNKIQLIKAKGCYDKLIIINLDELRNNKLFGINENNMFGKFNMKIDRSSDKAQVNKFFEFHISLIFQHLVFMEPPYQLAEVEKVKIFLTVCNRLVY